LRVAVAVRVARVLFLNPRRIGQHERAELARGRRAEDPAPKAPRDEARQVAAVVQVRVGENYGVDPRGIDRQRRPVAQPELLQALKETAVDKDAAVAEIEEMLGAGDSAGGSKKCQRRHRSVSPSLPND